MSRHCKRRILIIIAILLAPLMASTTVRAQPAPPTEAIQSGGWSTEQLQQQISAQWKTVSKAIVGEARREDLASAATNDIRCARLRPATDSLRLAFEDPQLEVSRARSTAPTYRGLDGFQQAIDSLKLDAYPQRRVKFKVFRINETQGGVTTLQFVQIVATGSSGTFEINATWKAGWVTTENDTTPRLSSLVVSDHEEARATSQEKTLFTDCTEAVFGNTESYQKVLVHSLDHWANRVNRVDPSGMQGLAIGDVDGDGLEDIYLCQSSELPNRLFRRLPDGTVDDISAKAGVDWHEQSHGALLVDLDNDGDQDLIVGTTASLLLMENDGQGHFTLRQQINKARGAYTLAAADYDLDGDLDIFACVYLPKSLRRQILAAPVPFHDARNGGHNKLLRNEGNWKFRDATRVTGLAAEATRRSFAASWEDYDNDGDPDLYVANDYGRNNLFRNDDGKFVDIAGEAGVQDQSFGMSGSWSDFDRNGTMDLYVANMFSAAGNRIVFQDRFRPQESQAVRSQFQYMARGNSLFQNQGNGKFQDVSSAARTMMGLWSWGSRFTDLNNDGYEDLIVSNGYLTRSDPADL